MHITRPRALPASVWWASAAFATLIGFSRVSFGLLLPFIKHDFPGTYTEYGIAAGANFAGYLAGLVGMGFLPRRYHDRRTNTTSLAVLAISLALSAFASNLDVIAIARFVNGLAQSVGTMLTIGLAFSVVPAELRGRASGVLWGGGGIGIVICALALPYAASAVSGWRAIWCCMAIVTVFVTVMLHRVLPHRPAEVESQSQPSESTTDRIAIMLLSVQYFFFGVAFADYFTYAPAFARELIAGTLPFAIAWAMTGLAGSFGGTLWGFALDRSRRGVSLGACLLLAGAGAAALLVPNLAAAAASAILVGSSSFGTPAQTTALARRFSSTRDYVYVLTIVTATFAVGQTLGAPMGGWLADAHSLAVAIAVSALIFVLGGVVALTLAWRTS